MFGRDYYTGPTWAPIRTVAGIEEARATPVMAGTRALLMDANRAAFYVKEQRADGSISCDEYTFERVEPPAPPEYATKQDLAALVAEIRGLRESFVATTGAAGADPEPDKSAEDNDAGTGEGAGRENHTRARNNSRRTGNIQAKGR